MPDSPQLKPEAQARVKIDEQLNASGWTVTKDKDAWKNGGAVAIEEWIFPNGLKADYLLFFKGKVIAVVEAKKGKVLLGGVYHQADKYVTAAAEDNVPKWREPIGFIYCANGKAVTFADRRETYSCSRLVFSFHRPETLEGWLKEGESTLADRLQALAQRSLPETLHLRDCQIESVTKLEESFATPARRAYVHLATGAGKTYMACTSCYRLLHDAKAKRILFLVDRTNLGSQAFAEFDQWKAPESGNKFTEDYIVQQLRSAEIPTGAKVVISTIQRIYSLLSGIPMTEKEDESSAWNQEHPDEPEKQVVYNAQLPPEFFDFIIVDECHRSIYHSWRAVLEYFDARIVGLTATPSPQTDSFFQRNKVSEYTYFQSVQDGVNVGYTIFRIKTRISEQGGELHADSEYGNYRKDQYTGKLEEIDLPENDDYDKSELNRRVESENQIRLVLQTYKDSIYTKLYPQRKSEDSEYDINYIPKTLIFAQTDAHAETICRVAKEVFGRGDVFCQKITCSVPVDTQGLIRDFRTNPHFRIAVTVDLVSTGTDIRPLEVLLFMRDVHSNLYYQQMVGRGCRTISNGMLQNVTPNAQSKDMFYLVDAVGVTEHVMVTPQPTLSGEQRVSLMELMLRIASWRQQEPTEQDVQNLSLRLSRLISKCKKLYYHQQMRAIRFVMKTRGMGDGDLLLEDASVASDFGLEEMASRLHTSPDHELFDCFSAAARRSIDELRLLSGILIDQEPDEILEEPSFSRNEAEARTKAFEEFLEKNRETLAALQFIYDATKVQEQLLADQLNELLDAMRQEDSRMRPDILWRHYQVLHPSVCKEAFGKSDTYGNLIQLVRYAAHLEPSLRDFGTAARARYELWLGRCIKRGTTFTDEQKALLDKVRDAVIYQFATSTKRMREVDSSLYPACIRAGVQPYLSELTKALIA